MCHILLLMPLLALPLFWLLPLSIALPIYLAIVLLSAWLYLYVFKALSRPVVTGRQEMLHSTGTVVDVEGQSLHVRVHGEVWVAEASDKLLPGEKVVVTGMNGLTLKVHRL